MRGMCAVGLLVIVGAVVGACAGDGSDVARVATAAGSFSDTLTLDDGSTCAYSLPLDGVEDDSAPWLCPSCATTFVSPFQLTTGADCLAPRFPGGPPPTFLFGWSTDQRFFFGFGNSFTSSSSGTLSTAGDSLTASWSSATDSGSAQLRLSSTPGDRLHGWQPPPSYDCGWPSAAPPPFTGSYQPSIGDPLPDAVLLDQCGQKLRLQDLSGSYVVLHMNQSDAPDYAPCGPCQMAAAGQAQFESDLSALGLSAFVVTLLVPTNLDVELSPPQDRLSQWSTTHGVTGPVLADRGFGPSVVGPAAAGGDLTQVGYPTLLLIGTDGTILSGTIGYDPMMWADLESRIQSDALK